MSRTLQRCTVRSCGEIADNTFLLRFHSPEIASAAAPGQFVNIRVEGPILRRPFSISRIEGANLELIFHAIGGGTTYLSRRKGGEVLDVIGPLGQPFRTEGTFDTALIVAGGIGVAPFPFLTNELHKKKKNIETFLGFRTAAQICSGHLNNVHLATDDGSAGVHGTVLVPLQSYLDQHGTQSVKIFGCGPTVMLKALGTLARQRKICCELSLEGQMACGVGICQGCPVERTDGTPKYALVCKDGPVFPAEEVLLP